MLKVFTLEGVHVGRMVVLYLLPTTKGSIMNVATLRELLENVDDNVEVVIAIQPSWPLQVEITNVVLNTEREEYDPTEGRDDEDSPVHELLWIATGGHSLEWDSPYAPSDVFQG